MFANLITIVVSRTCYVLYNYCLSFGTVTKWFGRKANESCFSAFWVDIIWITLLRNGIEVVRSACAFGSKIFPSSYRKAHSVVSAVDRKCSFFVLLTVLDRISFPVFIIFACSTATSICLSGLKSPLADFDSTHVVKSTCKKWLYNYVPKYNYKMSFCFFAFLWIPS